MRKLPGISITVEKASGVKCPRCWKITGEGRVNADGLCAPCCNVLIEDFPDLPIVSLILESRQQQRSKYGIKD